MRSVAVRFGLGDAEQLATDQGFQNATQEFALNMAKNMRGQGQITENERAMIERATVNIGFNPEANLRILSVLKRAASRAAQLNAMRVDLEGKGANEIQVAREIQKFVANNPIGAEALEDLAEADGGKMTRTATPMSGGIRMIAPDGSAGFVPADRVKDAEAKGFTRG